MMPATSFTRPTRSPIGTDRWRRKPMMWVIPAPPAAGERLVIITTFSADTLADVLGFLGLNPGGGGLNSTIGFQLEREYTPLVRFLPVDLLYLVALGVVIGVLAELYTRYVLTMQRRATVGSGTD